MTPEPPSIQLQWNDQALKKWGQQQVNVDMIGEEHPSFTPQIQRYTTTCYSANSLK